TEASMWGHPMQPRPTPSDRYEAAAAARVVFPRFDQPALPIPARAGERVSVHIRAAAGLRRANGTRRARAGPKHRSPRRTDARPATYARHATLAMERSHQWQTDLDLPFRHP